MKFRNIILAVLTAAAPSLAFAEAPSGYYTSCKGLYGKNLLEKLEDVIGSHTQVGYGGLWDLYETSDVDENGKIWDMYSTKRWTYSKEQCGTYSAVGDCYNREHSMPKSWFDDALPMYCDAFHIYPTDGKVNGQRSNYPYGECANGTTLSAPSGIKALGKLGACTFSGYSGTVFEPDDAYKGDFARSYFYMAACYNSLIDDWSSDMLAGNTYPAFTSWAVELLLKWHRQDPVSQKEIDRNEAVYAAQHNRNPFIDYPDMAEHVWGDKKTEGWTPDGVVAPEFVLPVAGTKHDFGYVTVGEKSTFDVTVKSLSLTEAVKITSTDAALTPSKTSVTATDANSVDGVTITLQWAPTKEGKLNATVTFASGSVSTTVTLTGEAVGTLKANAAKQVSDCSFVASWNYVGNALSDGTYAICCQEKGDMEVQKVYASATDKECLVDGLMPTTTYVYWVESKTAKSNEVEVTTAEGIPYIELLYDGVLVLEAAPGVESKAYELLVDAENIKDDINIEVTEPFALSTDKANWSQKLTLGKEEDRFYMHIYSDTIGYFSTTVKITAGSYVNDDIVIKGRVSENCGTFVEDFEADATDCDTYGGCEYNGTASKWSFVDAGIWAADNSFAHQGEQSVRFGKTASSSITMIEDKAGGMGTISLFASRWTLNDGNATFSVEFSADGNEWQKVGEATVVADDENYQEFTFDVNDQNASRMRIVQTAGKRFMLDDIMITDYDNGANGIDDVDQDYHSWDAFCRDGVLVIESSREQKALVFGLDGVIRFEGNVRGEKTLELAPGTYVVAIDYFSRKVTVK